MRTAFLFPGQGSHRPGAASAWAGHPAAQVFQEVSDGIGRDVTGLDDDPEVGSHTADAQPAILAASLVAWRALTDLGVVPDLVAGHSLGEYTAAIAAGSLSVHDGAKVVAVRSEAMAAACAANPGTMAAVVKLAPEVVAELVEGIPGVVVANDNAPGQVVVAGPIDAVAEVRDAARNAGGRAVPLEVEGAFHSPAMTAAVPPVAELLDVTPVADPVVPVVSGSSAAPLERGEEIRTALVDGILAPVRWREVQERIRDLGVTDLVEFGPGGVLAGLAKRTIPEVNVHTVATPDDLRSVAAALDPTRSSR